MKRPLGIVLSLALSFLLTLAGCSGGETASALPQAAEGTLSLAPDQPVHLAVVAGEAANSPTHDYTGEVLSSLLTTLCRQGGHLTLVEADGAPYLLYSEAVAAPDASLTENKQDQIVQAQVTQAAAFLTENAVPKTAEVDLVAALDLAALGLQGQAGNRVLYAAFNGLSTAGPMDFTQNLLRADPEAVADALEAVATKVYRADGVDFTPAAKRQLAELRENGFGNLPVCVAKTQYSFSDNAKALGAPEGFRITVRELKVSAGAHFVVALTGSVLTMPGLPKVPAAENIDVDNDGNITGLF